MKLYRVNYYTSDESEQSTEWTSSKRKAEKIARDNKCGDYDAHIKEVEVPTDRAGLLAFLNENIWSWEGAQAAYGGRVR